MVYITGDCHGRFDDRFSSKNFPEQWDMRWKDFVIVCGDFGLWHNDKKEAHWKELLTKKTFTLLFVDGNHENFDRLYSDEFEVVDFHGGKAHKICENVYHLMRGYVFDLCGKTFFTFGGARSTDIKDGILYSKDFKNDEEMLEYYHKKELCGCMMRINHLSWWEQEMPSKKEMDFGLQTLESVGNKVDFIVTHCCPQEIAPQIYKYAKADDLTEYFNVIKNKVNFSKWFFGHYHENAQVKSKYVALYDQIMRVV